MKEGTCSVGKVDLRGVKNLGGYKDEKTLLFLYYWCFIGVKIFFLLWLV